jgi:hypothetical protein
MTSKLKILLLLFAVDCMGDSVLHRHAEDAKDMALLSEGRASHHGDEWPWAEQVQGYDHRDS